MTEAPFCVLHDGIIHSVTGTVPGIVSLHIECDYLRRRLPVSGDFFIINLIQCRSLAYVNGQQEITDLKAVGKMSLEIVGADLEGGEVVVYCGVGVLHLQFDRLEVLLNEETEILLPDLERAALEYWNEWSVAPN